MANNPFKDTRDPLVQTMIRNSEEREAAKLKRALDLLSRYYWTETRSEGARIDGKVHDFFIAIGEEWRTRSLERPADTEGKPGA